jgi:hypothetical protein
MGKYWEPGKISKMQRFMVRAPQYIFLGDELKDEVTART